MSAAKLASVADKARTYQAGCRLISYDWRAVGREKKEGMLERWGTLTWREERTRARPSCNQGRTSSTVSSTLKYKAKHALRKEIKVISGVR